MAGRRRFQDGQRSHYNHMLQKNCREMPLDLAATRPLLGPLQLTGGGRSGHGIPPPAAPCPPHLWPPINICRGRRGWWPWQGWVCTDPISGSARSRWSRYSHPAWSAARSAQTASGCSAGPRRLPCSVGLQGWAPRRDTAGHK